MPATTTEPVPIPKPPKTHYNDPQEPLTPYASVKLTVVPSRGYIYARYIERLPAGAGADSKMVTCGHQFHMGDECDWLISSSAVCPINGNLSATKILKELIEAHCKTRKQNTFGEIKESTRDRNNESDSPRHTGTEYFEQEETQKLPELILEAKEIPLTVQNQRKKTKDRTGSQCYASGYYDSDDFDENQHLDGCPVKWFYRKRTKDGWGPCVALNRTTEGSYKEGKSGKKFRDRIPLEVKIGKISLNKRQPLGGLRNVSGKRNEAQGDLEKCGKFEIDPKLVEIQKRKLEAKLNWRPFQEDHNEEESELSYDRSSKNGYLRAKSALGGKLPVSILLFPYQQQNCFCGRGSHQEVSKIRVERVSSAGQDAKSSNDTVPSGKISRPKTTQFLRWGTKTQRKGKRLQLPKQLNVLFDAPKKRHVKHSANLPGVKRQGEKATGKTSKRNSEDQSRNNHTLTSLYYELEDKSNSGKPVDDEHLEKMIRELSMEDNLRGIRNILNPGFSVKKKKFVQGKDCHYSISQWSDDDRFKIICKQVKFSKRIPKGRASSSDAETPGPRQP